MKKIVLFFVSLFLIHAIEAQTTLNEGFETWPLTGWQIQKLGTGTRAWIKTFDGTTHSGTGSAYSNIDNSGLDNWMISPAINIINANYLLKFWEINKGIGFYDQCDVLVSSRSNDATSGDFNIVYNANVLNDEAWEERTIDLSAYNGETIYVAFRYQGTFHEWYLDDVSVSPISFTDAALSKIISPVGVSEAPVETAVIIEVENLGTTIINDFNISWDVNTGVQPTHNVTALNLQPGQSANIEIGTYNFVSEGTYDIKANLNLLNDFDSSNNQTQNMYTISSFKDGALVGITPEGNVPNAGSIAVIAEVENSGINTINIAEITWSVDGVTQTPYTTTSLNLLPGETRAITLGQYGFVSGLYDISATLNALGDINSANNQYAVKTAIDTFWESFEGNVFPPDGWSVNFGIRDDVKFDTPVDGEYYYVSSSDNNYFGIVTDTIYTPLLDIKSGDRFRFYIKTAPPTPQNLSLVWKNGTTGEVTFIQTIANSPGMNTWALRDYDISSAAGTNYIGIVATSNSYGESKYDLFTSDAKLHLDDRDLKILEGDMYFMAKQNVSEKFECKIRNNGKLPVLGSNYTLKLMEAPNTEIASVSGVDLGSWEESTITINHTFTEISQKRLFFKIEYSADQNLANNTFRETSVSVVPNTVEISEMGSPDIWNNNMPFTAGGNTNTLGEDDMSQLLFYNNEFMSPGYVYGLAYKYDNVRASDNVTHYPLKVWISQTSEANLENGWLPQEQLTLVFDGVIDILPGYNRDLFIPFNQPVLINGIENVVIKCYQYDPEWPPSIFRIYSTNGVSGPTRSIAVTDVFNLDPNDTSIGFNSFSDIVYTRFVVDPSASKSVLSGVVYNNATTAPLANASLSLENSNITVQSDSNGAYAFPELPYGNYNIKVSANGFLDETVAVELNASAQTQDVYLTPRVELQVIGAVYGNNNVALGLESVDVSILKDGNVVETVKTDANGDFIFPLVFGGFDYQVKIFMYGYYEEVIDFSTVNNNIDLGNIVLEQEFISPFDVTVNSDAATTVNWKSPKLSKKVKLQKDLNANSFSLTNSPNENVWLGNFFPISQITTLTSVEIRTDFYPNATDYVTIDIFDLASNKVLATSEPFLMYPDSLMTVDIPNIVVTKTITAMVHWQNNAASTNALVLDYSDPNISNSAMIKYPDTNPQLLSVFFGTGSPKMSFIVRVNTLDDGNPVTNTESLTYNVYRGLDSEFPDISNWEKINLTPVADVSLIDLNTSGIDPSKFYRYAVETLYSNGISEVTFSNSVAGNVLGISDVQLLSSEISVYPVPANDKINIKFGPNIQVSKPIKVFDILGKEVLMLKSSNIKNGSISQSVNSLQKGIYLIRIDVDGVIINKKFIVN